MRHALLTAALLSFLPLGALAQEPRSSPETPPADPPQPSEVRPQPVEAAPEVEAERRSTRRAEQEADAQYRSTRWNEPKVAERTRVFAIGASGGLGVMGIVVPSYTGYGYSSSGVAGLLAPLPTLELRAFTASGMSIDFTIPLGDIIRGFVTGPHFASDAYLNFSPEVARGVRLMVGPGLGVSFGYVAFGASPYGYGSGSGVVGGWVRTGLQAGVEFLAADGLLGVSLMARPFAGALFISYGPAGPMFMGGFLGVVGLTFNFWRG